LAEVPAVGAGVTLVTGFVSGAEFDDCGAGAHAVKEIANSSEINILFFLMRFPYERKS
jgi:hypothetical protein